MTKREHTQNQYWVEQSQAGRELEKGKHKKISYKTIDVLWKTLINQSLLIKLLFFQVTDCEI